MFLCNRIMKTVPIMAISLSMPLFVQTADAATYRAPSVSILQQKSDGAVKGQSFLSSAPENILWGRLPNRNTKPVLTIRSGETITIDTVSHEGLLEDQGKNPEAYFGGHGVNSKNVLKDALAITKSNIAHDFDKDGPHIVTGPVFVEGAKPGDVLKVEVLHLEPRVPYGVISNRHYKGALPGEFPEGAKRQGSASPHQPDKYGNVSVFTPIEKVDDRWYGILKDGAKSLRFPLSPFVGIMGVTPDTEESWSSVPPARIGGNIDVNELGVGATLYLPIEVEGAKFYSGDPHFVQGDGEVALTALEGSLRATFRLTVLKNGSPAIPKTASDSLVSPFAETEKYWIPIGLDEDLDEAMKSSVRESINFLSKQFGLDRRLVYAYLSAAVDYEVSQVVDKTKGIHALVPKADFNELVSIQLNAGSDSIPVNIIRDTMYVPATQICKALSLTLSQDKTEAEAPSGKIRFMVDSNRYAVNGISMYLEVSPIEKDGVLLLPVQAISEVMGISVTWATEGTKIIGTATKL